MQDVVTFRDSVSDPMYAYLQLKVGYGSVKIIKTSEDGEVSGISFTVSGNGTEQTVMTNADGEMQLDDLHPGVYTVTEQNSDRYEPQEVRQVTVLSGQVATVTFHNRLKRGSLEVVKTAEDGLNEGVKFHLTGTSLAGLPVDEYAVTGSNGKAVFSDVLIGTDYILSEVDTDIRYVVPEDQTTAVEWNTVTQAEVRNAEKSGAPPSPSGTPKRVCRRETQPLPVPSMAFTEVRSWWTPTPPTKAASSPPRIMFAARIGPSGNSPQRGLSAG